MRIASRRRPSPFPLGKASVLRGLAFLSLTWAATSLSAQENLADLPPFREGCQALSDERYDTATDQFRHCWNLLREAGATGPEANFVAIRLLEALVRSGETEEAVSWLEANPSFQPLPRTSYWIARALQAEERFAEAAEHYQIALGAHPDLSRAARIDRAVCLARSARPGAACDLVADLKPASPEEALRLAQIAALGARTAEALALLPEEGLDDPAWQSLRLPLARLRSALQTDLGDRTGALNTILHLIEKSPDAESARQAFLLLEVHLEGQRPLGLEERFANWTAREDFPGRELAALYRSHLLDEEPTRSETLRRLADSSQDPLLKREALLRLEETEFGEASGQDELPPEALQADLGDRLDHARATHLYASEQFEETLQHFTALAERSRGERADRALFNAAVTALRSDAPETFTRLVKRLSKRNPRSPLLADLGYLGGLALAAKGEPGAFERLQTFVREHPDHPSHIDARLALAEIHLNQAPARPREASEILGGLRSLPLTLAQNERLDYTSVWVEWLSGVSPELLRHAEEFVANWPRSSYLDEILMLLASAHGVQKNFDAAAEAYRRVATEFPQSPHAGVAAFLAAKASPPTEETLAAWRKLMQPDNPLADQAAHELGLLLISLDRFEEARQIFIELEERLPSSAPLRFAVLADLAYSHYIEALASDRDPAKLEAAASHFAALSSLDSAPPRWRYNAAVRRGKCLESLGKNSVALEIYRSIVEETRSQEHSGTALPPEESEWVFRAGFAAIEILESEKNWAGAIEIADALSDKNGSRAIEATRLAERLRLKHWVWD